MVRTISWEDGWIRGYSQVELTVGAVEVRYSENVGSTALGSAVQAGARNVGLAILELGGNSGDEAGEEGSDGSGALHVERRFWSEEDNINYVIDSMEMSLGLDSIWW